MKLRTSFMVLFAVLIFTCFQVESLSKNFQENSVELSIPPCPLAEDSLCIETRHGHLREWELHEHRQSYAIMQKVAWIWKEEGIHDYLVFGREEEGADFFRWEMVPYRSWNSLKLLGRFWNQFSVLWKISFGGPCLTEPAFQYRLDEYLRLKHRFSEISLSQNNIPDLKQGDDPFCQESVIKSQCVFEDNSLVRVLYNYAPISMNSEKLHFLIVPKMHRESFDDLLENEYVEAMKLAVKMIIHFQERGYQLGYLFHKTGLEAGQSVPHWHLHLIFATTKSEELWGELLILKNMMFGSSPLPQRELQEKVARYQNELADVLKNRS